MADKLLRFKDILEMDEKGPLEDPRPLSFDDMHVTEYRPGEDELTNYRAYRRKRVQGAGSGEGGPIGESTQKEGLFDRVGDKVAKAKRAISKGMPKHVAMAKYLVTSKELDEETEVDEALTTTQRLARKRQFQRIKSKVKLGRERAKRRIASKEKLLRRARKKAREAIYKKITKDIPKGELSYARRQEIEKRLEKPSFKSRIDRIAKKLFPKVRQAELAKKRGAAK